MAKRKPTKRRRSKRKPLPPLFCVFQKTRKKQKMFKGCAPSKTRAKKIRRYAEKVESHLDWTVRKPTAAEVKRLQLR